MLQKFNPKNKDLIVNIDGQLVHRDKAGISPFDSAVQGGDAVWEGPVTRRHIYWGKRRDPQRKEEAYGLADEILNLMPGAEA